MLDTVIIPLIKDKNGDVQDVDNYRPLALTCIVSKLFEFVILNRYAYLFKTCDDQFGFKRHMSTDMCILALKETVNYYKTNNNPVFACFLDASKAFDKLNHFHLFKKLILRGLPCIIVRILLFLYTNQSYCVRWGGHYSQKFSVSNGVPQGRILSPFFFNIYVDDLSILLNKSGLGCHIKNAILNHLFYADDAVLLASSPYVLQKLLNICAAYAKEYELEFNIKKTKCLIFAPKFFSKCTFPKFYLNDKELSIATRIKYLGCIIRNDCKDSIDVSNVQNNDVDCKESSDLSRLIRSIYTKGNININKYFMCSEDVKVKLFKSYLSSFYGLTVISNFNNESYRKLNVAYKRIFRALFMFKMFPQGTSMKMVELGIDPLPVIERTLLHGFYNRIFNSNNVIVKSIFDNMFLCQSPFLTRYYKQVYFNQSFYN